MDWRRTSTSRRGWGLPWRRHQWRWRDSWPWEGSMWTMNLKVKLRASRTRRWSCTNPRKLEQAWLPLTQALYQYQPLLLMCRNGGNCSCPWRLHLANANWCSAKPNLNSVPDPEPWPGKVPCSVIYYWFRQCRLYLIQSLEKFVIVVRAGCQKTLKVFSAFSRI